MQSKGGYEYNCALSEAEPQGINLKTEEHSDNAGQPNGPTGQNNENTSTDTTEPNRTDDTPNEL